MDRGDWRAKVHGIAKSQTWLSTHTLPSPRKTGGLVGCEEEQIIWQVQKPQSTGRVCLSPISWAHAEGERGCWERKRLLTKSCIFVLMCNVYTLSARITDLSFHNWKQKAVSHEAAFLVNTIIQKHWYHIGQQKFRDNDLHIIGTDSPAVQPFS